MKNDDTITFRDNGPYINGSNDVTMSTRHQNGLVSNSNQKEQFYNLLKT